MAICKCAKCNGAKENNWFLGVFDENGVGEFRVVGPFNTREEVVTALVEDALVEAELLGTTALTVYEVVAVHEPVVQSRIVDWNVSHFNPIK